MRDYYDFEPLAQLRLQVEGTWPSGLPNIVRNPTGLYGSWGWIYKTTGNLTTTATPSFRITRGTFASPAVATERMAVRPSGFNGGGNRYVRGRVRRSGGTSGVGFTARFDFLAKNGALVSSSTATSPQTTNSTLDVPAVQVPATAAYAQLLITSTAGTSGQTVEFTDVVVVNGTAAEVAVVPTVEPNWIDLLSPASEMKIDRKELDLGTLTAVVRDSNLDPAQFPVIRKGKRVRAQAKTTGGAWEHLFAGTIIDADTAYDPKQRNAAKRATISIRAVDPANPLASTPRPDGVAAIANLPQVLNGTGVPWNVNGSSNLLPSAVPVVARSDNASALDQVALTRDTALGFAWVSRRGILNAWDAAQIPATVVATLDEDDYSDLKTGFDLEDLINDVTVIVRTLDTATGETTEVRSGPYVDEVSQREWGKAHKDFTVIGTGWTNATIEAYVDKVLAANSIPRVRVNSVTLPISTVAQIAPGRGLADLYERVRVTNAATGLDQTLRVNSISHTITPRGWLVTLGFGETGSVATPNPEPPASSKGVGAKGIQSGLAGLTFPASSRSTGVVLTFPSPFAAPPIVVVSAQDPRFVAGAYNATTSQVTIDAYFEGTTVGGVPYPLTVSWIAHG